MPEGSRCQATIGDLFFVRKNASIKLHPNAGAARGAWGRHWDLGPSAGLGGDGAGEGPGPPAGPSVGPVAIRGAWGGHGLSNGNGTGFNKFNGYVHRQRQRHKSAYEF